MNKYVKIISWILLGGTMVGFGVGNGLFISQKFEQGANWFYIAIACMVIMMVLFTYEYFRMKRKFDE